ncbi:metallophosphatase family protein [bacterium]|nr:metallophosphatase family protein [bacterium]
MKLALISDIHSNIEALTTALKSIAKQKVDRIACLGDVVGYGANPSDCLKLVREHADWIIMGNHDAAAVGIESLNFYNDYARQAALWTRNILTEEETEFLKTLPMEIDEADLHFVHSTPRSPKSWNYIFSLYDVTFEFSAVKGHTCFVGHSHVPGYYHEKDAKLGNQGKDRRIINVGSVGQPRDRDPRLCYAVFDSETRELQLVREEYDIKAAAHKIRKAGLPGFLAERLEHGW